MTAVEAIANPDIRPQPPQTGNLEIALQNALAACRRAPGGGTDAHIFLTAFSKASRYCLAHAQCPVVAISPPALVSELGHGRLAWAFWRRSLTPEQVLRDRDRPAA